MKNITVTIESRDYWFKVIEMLQTNWALIAASGDGVIVFFLGDASGVFDEIHFDSERAAEESLSLNGFGRFAEDPNAANYLYPPAPPFRRQRHPNGPIYSSGRFWESL